MNITFEELKEIPFDVGDKVVVPKNMTAVGKGKVGVITQFYKRFFNVRYKEGYEQSISYFDLNKIKKAERR